MGPRFSAALAFANKIHGKQHRKGTRIPYISHLLAVTSLVIEAEGNEDMAIAALLHDAAEDQGGERTLARIRKRFGPRVANIVESCSDTMVHPKPDWRVRKKAYLAAIPNKPPRALVVSLADKVHNANSMLEDYRKEGERLWKRFNASKEDQLWYYRSLVRQLRGRTPKALWQRLDDTVRALRSQARIRGVKRRRSTRRKPLRRMTLR